MNVYILSSPRAHDPTNMASAVTTRAFRRKKRTPLRIAGTNVKVVKADVVAVQTRFKALAIPDGGGWWDGLLW
jgi:hypothetical protein